MPQNIHHVATHGCSMLIQVEIRHHSWALPQQYKTTVPLNRCNRNRNRMSRCSEHGELGFAVVDEATNPLCFA